MTCGKTPQPTWQKYNASLDLEGICTLLNSSVTSIAHTAIIWLDGQTDVFKGASAGKYMSVKLHSFYHLLHQTDYILHIPFSFLICVAPCLLEVVFKFSLTLNHWLLFLFDICLISPSELYYFLLLQHHYCKLCTVQHLCEVSGIDFRLSWWFTVDADSRP